MTEGEDKGEEKGTEEEDTHSMTIFGPFQTVIKSELIGISICSERDPPRIVLIYSYTHETKQSG